MYDELVKRLREHNGWALNETLDEAADAIEELSASNVRPVVVCANCEHNNHCLTQEFVEDCGKIPLDRSTFFCADGERRSNA